MLEGMCPRDWRGGWIEQVVGGSINPLESPETEEFNYRGQYYVEVSIQSILIHRITINLFQVFRLFWGTQIHSLPQNYFKIVEWGSRQGRAASRRQNGVELGKSAEKAIPPNPIKLLSFKQRFFHNATPHTPFPSLIFPSLSQYPIFQPIQIYVISSLFLLIILEGYCQDVNLPFSVPNLEVFALPHVHLQVGHFEGDCYVWLCGDQQELESFVWRFELLLESRHQSVFGDSFGLNLGELHFDQHLLLVRLGVVLLLASVYRSPYLYHFGLWLHLFLLRDYYCISSLPGLSSGQISLMFLALGVCEITSLISVIGQTESTFICPHVISQKVWVLGDIYGFQGEPPQLLSPLDIGILVTGWPSAACFAHGSMLPVYHFKREQIIIIQIQRTVYMSRKTPSNSETGCIDSARMALLKKLAAVNLFNNHDISIATPQKSQPPHHSHSESQRSNSMFDLLHKELSQVSNNTYNMPRQIKSLFSANDSNFPPYKQFTATVETDIHLLRQETPKQTLKESIYQKLLRGKSKGKGKTGDQKGKKVEEMIKQATFRPQKGTLKSISKQVFRVDPFKIKNQGISKIKSTLQTEETPRNLTRYQQLLKYSQLISNREKDREEWREKENIDSNNDVSILPITAGCGREISEEEVMRMNLKKSLELKQRFFQNYCTLAPEKHRVGMLDLNFQERQNSCIRSRSLKIIKNDIEKLKNQMRECTFKPKLTPYTRPTSKDPLNSERRYGDMRRSTARLVHYR